jgi:hypothetical protein
MRKRKLRLYPLLARWPISTPEGVFRFAAEEFRPL